MKFFATLALALPALALAVPSAKRDSICSRSECTTGPVQCCNSHVEPTSAEGEAFIKLAGYSGHENVNNGSVGITCSPLADIVKLGKTCSSQPTCCTTNGPSLISIGCIPISI